MRKVILYIATSLDGFIARPDGRIDWLENAPNPTQTDYGYALFLAGIDTTLMGNSTYKTVLGFDIPFPYPDKENYVFTRNANVKKAEYVQFISENIPAFVQHLKAKKGKDIWLIGGGEINTLLLNAGLIDEIMLTQMPVLIGEGIPLFAKGAKETLFELTYTQTFESGAVIRTYSVV